MLLPINTALAALVSHHRILVLDAEELVGGAVVARSVHRVAVTWVAVYATRRSWTVVAVSCWHFGGRKTIGDLVNKQR